MSTITTRRNGAIGVAVAGLLMAAGGGLHPRVDTTVGFDEGLAGMFESSVWTASHGLTMAGYVALAVALTLLLRSAGIGSSRGLRLTGWVAAAAAVLAAVEFLPHVLRRVGGRRPARRRERDAR